MLMTRSIETARLILRPESPSDSANIHTMNCDPDVMRYVGDGRPWTSPLTQFVEQHRRALERSAARNWGGACVRLKDSGQFIGLCWLAPSALLGGRIELGYRYIRAAWGKGYATEAGLEVVRLGLDVLNLSEILSVVHLQNVARSGSSRSSALSPPEPSRLRMAGRICRRSC